MTANKISKLAAIIAAVAALNAGSAIYAAEDNDLPASLDADTVEYDMKTGIVTAVGDVLMKRGSSMRVAGERAVYNINTKEGTVEGKVVAVRDDIRITCDKVTSDGQEHMTATGNVYGTQLDRSFTGERVDYFPNQNKYILVESGGRVSNKDGVFTADRLEGWLDDEHYVGTGNAHLVSPARQLEAGGDRFDYYAKERGKLVMTGNAWAVQNNNTVKSNRLTMYLTEENSAAQQ